MFSCLHKLLAKRDSKRDLPHGDVRGILLAHDLAVSRVRQLFPRAWQVAKQAHIEEPEEAYRGPYNRRASDR